MAAPQVTRSFYIAMHWWTGRVTNCSHEASVYHTGILQYQRITIESAVVSARVKDPQTALLVRLGICGSRLFDYVINYLAYLFSIFIARMSSSASVQTVESL